MLRTPHSGSLVLNLDKPTGKIRNVTSDFLFNYFLVSEWKATASRCLLEIQTAKGKSSREESFRMLREKASDIYKEVVILSYFNIIYKTKLPNPNIFSRLVFSSIVSKFLERRFWSGGNAQYTTEKSNTYPR